MHDTLIGAPLRLGEIMIDPGTHGRIEQLRARGSAFHYTPLDPERILVGMLLPIGDTLLATPALAALRKRFPWAKIAALVSYSNAGILEDNPNLDELVYVADRGSEPKVQRFARRLLDIRRQKYDLVVNFSPVGTVVLRMAGVYHDTLHMEMPPLWWLIGNHSKEYRSRHAVDHYVHAVREILDGPLTEDERQPRLHLTARDRSSARRLLRQWGLSPANLLVTMHVGGDGFNGRKRWAPERFAQVARHLIATFNAQVLLVGGNADTRMSQEVAALIPHGATVVAGKTSLKETGALIEMSALFVGNDSCPLHISAAVGTPSVAIFGPSDYQHFQPIGRRNYRQRVVHSSLPCSPCFRFIGNDAPWVPNTCYSMACLNAIQPEQVVKAAVELLEDSRAR
jgi:lipopolysaccharide heptosyltransferase II